MAYQKTVYVNDSAPAISAENLNKSENKIYELDHNTEKLIIFDEISLIKTNLQSYSVSSGVGVINKYGDVILQSGRKYLISVRLSSSITLDFTMGIAKPGFSGWVNSSLMSKTISSNDSAVFNVIYELPQNGIIGFRFQSSNAPSGTIEAYAYDITEYNENEFLPLKDSLYNLNFASYSISSKKSEESYLTENMKLKLPDKLFNFSGSTFYYKITDFAIYSGHQYLYVITGSSLSGLVSSGVIGFMTSSSTWAERFPYTKEFESGGGYVVCTPPNNADLSKLSYVVSTNNYSVNGRVVIYDITGLGLTSAQIDLLANNSTGIINALDFAGSIFETIGETDFSQYLHSKWTDKNVLFIGDSITAANKYQYTVQNKIGINIFNHCKGGMGIVQCVDGENGAPPFDPNDFDAGTLYPLNSDDVTDKDLIIFYAGYNNRGTADGEVGDVYDPEEQTGKTIAGYMQYAINRIYEELATAGNLTCKLLIVTVDCAGKYPYIDVDGYGEYPSDSGRTMETMANIQKAVAEANNLKCLDLWHNSGINKNTWTVFGKDPQAYYVSEKYPDTPYPHNGDQLHKSDAGYVRIGECIVGAILDGYGN